MAKLSDINLSNQVKESPTSSLVDQQVSDIAVDGTTPNDTKWFIFKLVNTKATGGVYISGVDDVINPITKKMERVRLLSGVDTIWQKDQKDLTPEFIKANQRFIEFPKGARMLRVPDWDTTLLDFVRLTRHNIKSPNRKSGSRMEFFEYDPAAQQRAAYEKEMLEMQMTIKANDQPVEKMKRHAAFLGIVFTDELGRPKTNEGIRMEYMLKAKRDPAYFQKTLDSKEVDIAYKIRLAILDSLIDIHQQPGNLNWAKGGLIAKLPPGQDAQKYLLDLALTNTEEGRNFLQQLQSLPTT